MDNNLNFKVFILGIFLFQIVADLVNQKIILQKISKIQHDLWLLEDFIDFKKEMLEFEKEKLRKEKNNGK